MNLVLIIAASVLCHAAFTGVRVAVSLQALTDGGSPFVIGVLMALMAVLPMILGVASGRWTDRVGARRPLLVGGSLVFLGALLPAVFPVLPVLFLTAALIGTGMMAAQVALQNAVGELSAPAERAQNFSQMAIGMSLSSFAGPLIAGFAIDHFGYRVAFAVLAALPLVAVATLRLGRLQLPPPSPHAELHVDRNILDLLRTRELRRVLLASSLLAIGWDLHTFFVPIFGTQIGLSASQIGSILAAFALATLLIRLAMRWIAKRYTEWQVLTRAIFVVAGMYILFPFAINAWQLMLLSFTLGLGLGAAQPMVMALVHRIVPEGRAGEALGLRTMLMNSSQVALPLVFGAVSATLGMTPVFWSVAMCLGAGGYYTRKR
ncbi:MAG: MFS transporter [Betaproteobacteria bacterium]|nr:MFS transporter [Betaproteobacteria bacterium]